MRDLNSIDSFGKTDAVSDPFILKCFQDHKAYLDAKSHERFLVLGRKGSGKTAVKEKLISLEGETVFTSSKCFNDYPQLYDDLQKKLSVPEEERYVESWKYLIFKSLGEILSGSSKALKSSKHLAKIKKLIDDLDPSTTRVLDCLKGITFKGVSVDFKKNQDLKKMNGDLGHKVFDALNKDCNGYICFDGLDIDFNGKKNTTIPQKKLIALIQAANEVNIFAKKVEKKNSVLLFLRTDIYDLLNFSNKSVITEDSSSQIEWGDSQFPKLKDLMEKRFSHVLGDLKTVSWGCIFSTNNSSYDDILDRTFLRPRDIIRFCNGILKEYQERIGKIGNAYGAADSFTSADICSAYEKHSKSLLDELQCELLPHISEFDDVKKFLSSLGHIEFTKAHFESTYKGNFPTLAAKYDTTLILEKLFEFSIIEYKNQSGGYIQKYRDTLKRHDNSAEQFKIHLGLKEALGLVEGEEETKDTLPPPPKHFIGRHEILEELGKDKDSRKRLIGIVGEGGIGKSALAAEFAQAIRKSFPDGRVHVQISESSKAQKEVTFVQRQVIWAINPDRTVFKSEKFEKDYKETLTGKKVLILIDSLLNIKELEQLVPPKGCLLIFTSRSEKPTDGNYLSNETLSFHEVPHFTEEESIEYLLKKFPDGTLHKEHLKAIAQFCGHLPLRLSFSDSLLPKPDKIKELKGKKGEDVLEFLIESKYKTLSKEDKVLLCGLDVFPHYIGPGAASQVVVKNAKEPKETKDAEKLKADTRESLERLKGNGLLEFNENRKRYHFHKTIRDFIKSKQKDAETDLDSLKKSFSSYFLKKLEEMNDKFLKGGPDLDDVWKTYDKEQENIKYGWQWAVDNDAELCMEYPMVGFDILGIWQTVDERIKWHEKAKDAAEKDSKEEGRHLGFMGVNYRLNGDTDKSILDLNKALEIAKKRNDHMWQAIHLSDLATTHLVMGDYEKAKGLYKRAKIKFCAIQRSNPEDRSDFNPEKGLAILNNGLARLYLDLGQPERAKGPSELALKISRELKDQRREAGALFNLGVISRHLGNPMEALENHEKALIIFDKLRDRTWRGITLTGKGRTQIDLGDLNGAEKALKKALEITREVKNTAWEGIAMGNIGIVYREKANLEKTDPKLKEDLLANAIEHFKSAIKLASKMKRRMAIQRNNLGRALMSKKQFQEAEEEYKEAMETAEEINDERRRGGILGDLGNLYSQWGEKSDEEALQYATEGYLIAEEIGDKRKVVNISRTIFKIQKKRDKIPEAYDAIKKAVEVGKDINIPYLKVLKNEEDKLKNSINNKLNLMNGPEL